MCSTTERITKHLVKFCEDGEFCACACCQSVGKMLAERGREMYAEMGPVSQLLFGKMDENTDGNTEFTITMACKDQPGKYTTTGGATFHKTCPHCYNCIPCAHAETAHIPISVSGIVELVIANALMSPKEYCASHKDMDPLHLAMGLRAYYDFAGNYCHP